MSEGTKDFLIGVAIMVAVIFLAIAISGRGWNPDTGNSADTPVGNCVNGSSAGC